MCPAGTRGRVVASLRRIALSSTRAYSTLGSPGAISASLLTMTHFQSGQRSRSSICGRPLGPARAVGRAAPCGRGTPETAGHQRSYLMRRGQDGPARAGHCGRPCESTASHPRAPAARPAGRAPGAPATPVPRRRTPGAGRLASAARRESCGAPCALTSASRLGASGRGPAVSRRPPPRGAARRD